jgi:hypothetical protein
MTAYFVAAQELVSSRGILSWHGKYTNSGIMNNIQANPLLSLASRGIVKRQANPLLSASRGIVKRQANPLLSLASRGKVNDGYEV